MTISIFKFHCVHLLILSLSLVVTSTALAGYVPPPDQKPPTDYTTSSGPRGGCEGDGIPLTALAPKTHLGATLSTHPTLAWFVPDSTIKPMEFRLYEYNDQGKPQPVGQPIQLQSSPGIMMLSLAREQLELTVGKTYLWQVVILCDSDSPSSDLIVSSDMQVVEMPLVLEQKLAQVKPGSEKVELYAGAGFWYDAMGEALQLAPPWQLGEVAASLLRDLVNLEAAQTRPESLPSESEPIENMRTIIQATGNR
ncbi:MAG: DUF928 domain-containing protein [Coleofasciculus sp. G3-WIS-01]|uniref:DUF928 domain-containing protein n=1 Tax=Coleofasciculus sp. G3-WIS-01 TaxID=3069528 RepID=UPI0032FF0CBF